MADTARRLTRADPRLDGVGMPRWWAARLENAMLVRQERMRIFDNYYRGDHPLPFLTRAHRGKMRSEFRGLLQASRSNFMRLVVDAVEERMQIDGFRLSAQSSEQADEDSWRIWQSNQMDAESQTAITESLIKGVSYVSVWPGDPYPTMAVEDALQTIVAYSAGSGFHQRDAGLKVWIDEWTGDFRANVYLPDGIYKFQRKGTAPTAPSTGTLAGENPQRQIWLPLDDPDYFVANRFNVVPLIPLRNRPRLLLEGESEIYDVIPSQDRINGELFMRALAGYMGAHRQRWVTGLKMYAEDGEPPQEPFDAAIDKLWQTEDPEVKFGEFSQTDLSGYIKAIEQDVLHIAVTTRTPRHYLFQEGQSPSGDAIQSAEAGLVKKVWRKMRIKGEGFEEAINLARRFQGLGDAPVDSEVIWADPEVQTEAELTDAAIKQFQAGLIPVDAALAKLGYSQTEIARYAAQRQKDQLMQALLNPAPPAAPGQPNPNQPPDAPAAPSTG